MKTSFNKALLVGVMGILSILPYAHAHAYTFYNADNGLLYNDQNSYFTGSVYVGGNIGIGTTSPGAKLEVSGDLLMSAGGSNSIVMNRASIFFATNNDCNAALYSNISGSNCYDATHGNDTMALNGYNGIALVTRASGDNVRMYIQDSTGNVGIGTTSPAAKLDVIGARYTTIGTGTAVSKVGGADVYLYTGALEGGSYGIWMQALRNSDAAQFPLLLQPNGGNVGIGTTGPGYKLEVQGTGYFSQPLVVGTPTADNHAATRAYVNSAIGGYWSATGSNIYSANSGYVGIGTSSPVSKFNVDGNITQSLSHGSNLRLLLPAARNGGGTGDANLYEWISEPGATWTGAGIARNMSNSNASFPRVNATLTGQMMRFDEAGNIIFYTETAGGSRVTPLFLEVDGTIGAGTTSPAAKLDIVGTFYSRLVSKGSCSGSVTIDWNQGNTQHCTLAGNVTFAFINGQSGANYRLILKQDGYGNRTASWPGNVRWGSIGSPSLSAAASKTDYVGFFYNGVDGTYDGNAFNAGF